MTTALDIAPLSERELALGFIIDAPRALVWRGWTEPALLTQWFTPRPWTTVAAALDVRAGGSSRVTMRSPEGVEMTHPGLYLEVIPQQRLVFTDAFTGAWEPSEKPFMTAVLSFEDAGTVARPGTRYIARVRHWSVADREAHERMGFHAGWGAAAQQLEELLSGMPE